MKDNLKTRAKRIISSNYYLTISSVSDDGVPWGTPVYFSFDEKFNFYWYSGKDSKHSENIRQNGQIFLTIFSPSEQEGGIYIEALAEELSQTVDVSKGIKVFDRKIYALPSKDPQLFLGDSPIRIYQAKVKKMFLSDTETATKYRGLWLDHRVEVELPLD